jgi:PAS domain S-box-containing protein
MTEREGGAPGAGDDRERLAARVAALEAELAAARTGGAAATAALLRAMTQVIVVLDADGRFLEVARTSAPAYLQPPADAVGRTLHDVHAPATAELCLAQVRRALRTGSPVVFEHRMDADGRPVWLESHLSPLDARRVLSVSLDITPQKRAEEALLESERYFRSVIEHVHDVVSVLDAEGTVVYESPAAQRVLGYAPGERLGRAAFSYMHPDDVERVRASFREMMAEPGTSRRADFRIRHRDGSWRTVEAQATNLLHDEAVRGVVVNLRDVTERHALEEQLRQSQRMEAIGKLAGGIAHDFNNLLTAIQGNTQLLLMDLEEGNPLREEAEDIDAAARRAAELTGQLLAFSRRQPSRARVVDLNEVVRDTERMLRRLIGEDVALLTEPAAELRPVRCDPGQVSQVLVNLAVNARDAMPQGGTLTIRTRDVPMPPSRPGAEADEGGAGVLLEVCDTGVGMDEATRDRAVEPFFTTKPAGKGTGLGLSTVYGIVHGAGGVLRIRSEPGEGTRVQAFLPAVEGEPDAGAPPAGEPAAPSAATVLLVEDDDSVREVARKALERGGFRVLATGGGADALAVFRSRRDEVDLVVTDVMMPGMSGPELLETLAAISPGVRVLFISGYPDTVLRRCPSECRVELIAKPFAPADLVRRVTEMLAG